MNKPPKLLDQVRERIRAKHYSIRTEDSYADWVRRFILFHGKRHPKELGVSEVEAFLTYLAIKLHFVQLRYLGNLSTTTKSA